jgi:hypothetical protein
MAVMGASPTGVTVHLAAPPPAVVEVTTLPSTSPATHNPVRQATDSRATPDPPLESTCVTVQSVAGPVGSVDVTMSPLRSVPTQAADATHDMPVIGSV